MKTYQKVIIAIAICGAGLFGFLRWSQKGGDTPIAAAEPIPVEAAQAKSGSIVRRFTTVGNLTAVQSVTIRPEVNGKIVKIFFTEGEEVKSGEELYKIDDALFKAKLMEAQANLDLKKEEYNRAATLLQKGFGTPQLRDRALAEMKIAQANLEEAKIRLEHTVIKAPFEGVMGLSKVSVGALVSESVELVNIVDLDPINVDFHVPESLLSHVHVGDIVDVTIEDFDILPVEATIKAISPEIEESTRSVSLRAELPNNELAYRPGEFARVLVVAGKADNAVLISETAIERDGEEEHVMVVVDNVAVKTLVSTGSRDGDEVEITHGVKAGDWVITSGQFKVHDGDEVTIVNEGKVE